jgi:hypothetical protein
MTVDFAFRIGVDRERCRIAGPHVVELNLLEVCRDPDPIRHKHRQARARLGELTDRGGQIDDTSRLRRCYGRVREIELRLVALGLGLREARERAVALSLERLDLPLRQLQGRLRTRKGGLLLVELRGILLFVLNGAIAGLPEVLVPRCLLLGKDQRRLRLVYLRLVGADLGLLHIELGIDVLDAGLRGCDLRLRLLECDAIVAVVDAGDHVPVLTCWLSVTGTVVMYPETFGAIENCRAATKASSVD